MRAFEEREKVEKLLKSFKEERARLPQFGAFDTNNWKDLDEAIDALDRILGEEYVDLDKLRDSESCFGYDLAEWIEGGDSQSDIYVDYCG